MGSDRPLSVCIATELSGGVGVYAANLLRGLSDLGVDLTVVTPHPDRVTHGKVVPVRQWKSRGRGLPQSLAFRKAFKNIASPFDLVHVTDARYAAFVETPHTPVVGTMNDYFYAITNWFSPSGTRAVYRDWRLRHIYYNGLRLLERKALSRMSGVICISQAVQDVMADRYSLPSKVLFVVPYGIDYGASQGRAAEVHHPTVLFAGGNYQRKGLHVLVRAAPVILAAVPGTQFVVVGASRDERLTARLTREVGVDTDFRFVGRTSLDELYAYYRSADVFTMPSILEAFGIPFLEAMHFGVPVVATKVPGPTDFLTDGHNAILTAAGDPRSLADGIITALTDHGTRRRLIAGGRSTAAEYTVARMARNTLSAYETVLSRTTPNVRTKEVGD